MRSIYSVYTCPIFRRIGSIFSPMCELYVIFRLFLVHMPLFLDVYRQFGFRNNLIFSTLRTDSIRFTSYTETLFLECICHMVLGSIVALSRFQNISAGSVGISN